MAPKTATSKKGAASKKGKAVAVPVPEPELVADLKDPTPIEEPIDEQRTLASISSTEVNEDAPDSKEMTDDACAASDEPSIASTSATVTNAAAATAPSLTSEERLAKVKALRQRMTESVKANRQDLITESNQRRDSARNLAKLERKRQQAEAMGEKQQALETGEDLERKRAWEYTIEDNEKWDKKVARKNRRADYSFTDYDDIARRKYKKDLDIFKPDHKAYNAQRDAAQGGASLVASSSNPDAKALLAAQDLYRDANSFVYADHKPSEDAIDRVVGKINLDLSARANRSRERKNEVEGDITYINEKNKHFNKKLDRYYDAVTKDIRDSFERGTAL